LYRFGGINSIRGFAENIFQANFMNSFQTEYRYIVSPSLFVHSILDYCYFQDKSTNTKERLTGIGFGIGLNTKTGILKFAFANGIKKNEVVKLNSAIIHISYFINF
jgi:hemolysin activation/secretion protein